MKCLGRWEDEVALAISGIRTLLQEVRARLTVPLDLRQVEHVPAYSRWRESAEHSLQVHLLNPWLIHDGEQGQDTGGRNVLVDLLSKC